MSTDERYVVKNLSPEEIESLQVDSALRLLANHTVHLNTINSELSKALQAEAQARCLTIQLKHAKSTLVSNMRSLECIARSA